MPKKVTMELEITVSGPANTSEFDRFLDECIDAIASAMDIPADELKKTIPEHSRFDSVTMMVN